MTELTQKCAEYFRANPGYHRMFTLLLKKYQSFGRPAGKISLPDATREECNAACALFGRAFTPPLSIPAADFQAALEETTFRGVLLKEVVECYFQTTIQTKHQANAAMEASYDAMLSGVERTVQSDSCRRWLHALSQRGGEGYSLLRTALRKGEPAEHALALACQCGDYLSVHRGETLRLAVLSAGVTSDPHALDDNTLSGKLFLHLLAFLDGQEYPATAEERDALRLQHAILRDSISSTVTQLGLLLYTPEGEHPAFQAFRRRREVTTLNLRNLAALSSAKSPCARAYLVENQMVFSQLCDESDAGGAPLICTSGQPTVAVLRLLDLLAASGTALYYSGDFDGMGLSMADQFLRRYPQHLHLWHMTPEDYAASISTCSLSEKSKTILAGIHSPALEATACAIQEKGRPGYQELLIPLLLADFRADSAPEGGTPAK